MLAHPLAPQRVNHLVINLDELVHLALAHGHELQREILGANGRRARRNKLKRPHKPPVQLHGEDDADEQQPFGSHKQHRVGGAQLRRQRNKHGVNDDDKKQEFETKRHRAGKYRTEKKRHASLRSA